jgi:hypothetical protein
MAASFAGYQLPGLYHDRLWIEAVQTECHTQTERGLLKASAIDG